MRIKDLYNQIRDGKIKSDISLQREIVYSEEKQVLVIDSLVKGIPLPAFYLWKNNKGILEVLDGDEARMFWFVWLLTFMMGCLIFLNFIIAEVSDSYAKVKEDIDRLIYKERATMVKEVEDFLSENYKIENKKLFPKHGVVVREVDT